MKDRRVLVAVLWLSSLLGVGLWAQGGAGANQRQASPPVYDPGAPIGPPITGENLGFQRVAAHEIADDRITGYFVVKVQGRWIPVTIAPVVR